MAFSTDGYVKSAAKSAGQRILNDVVSQLTTGKSMNIVTSASSTAESLFNAGASFQSISSITSMRTDSLVNQGSSVFYALAGKDPSRVSSTTLRDLRSTAQDDVNYHVYNINPTTAIRAKRQRDAENILVAVG